MGAAEVGRAESASRGGRVLKWVVGAGAIVSLAIGLFTVTRLASEAQERERAISESLATAKRQQSAGDFPAAWTTLEGAQKSADEGGQFAKLTGQLSDARRSVREAQHELAMLWLREVRVPADRKFSDIVDRLLPVLERGAATAEATASPAARADLLAHIGWAYFLKQRDGVSGLDPAAQYKSALAVDPVNPFGHAYWGHYLLSRGERTPAAVAEGIGHFDAAARSGREKPMVRAMQFAALRNLGDDSGAPHLLRLVDEMRRGSEPMPATVARDMQTLYARIVVTDRVDEAIARALPAERHAELARAMFEPTRNDPARNTVRDVVIAMLYEAGGDPERALEAWRGVRASLAPDNMLRVRADAAIKRLGALPRRTG